MAMFANKDSNDYNREMKVVGLRYKTVWVTDKKTGYQYKRIITIISKSKGGIGR